MNYSVTLFSNVSRHGIAYCIALNLNTANALTTLRQTTGLIKLYFVNSVLVTKEEQQVEVQNKWKFRL